MTNSSVLVNISDIETYTVKLSEPERDFSFSNLMGLQSQIYVAGLSKLNSSISQNDDFATIKHETQNDLLKDLELVSKRAEMSGAKIPLFAQSFYEELSMKPAERSPEYNDFISTMSQLRAGMGHIEAISAKALLELDKEEASKGQIQQLINKELKAYKDSLQAQTSKDIDATQEGHRKDHNAGRSKIILKDQNGESRFVSAKEFYETDNMGLTGEQKDFLQTSWHQGLYNCGWYTNMFNQEQTFNVAMMDNSNRTALFIDLSQDSKVLVSNQILSTERDLEDLTKTLDPYVNQTLTVDISTMQGDEYLPGCSSAKPQIEFTATALGSCGKLKTPDGLVCQTNKKHNIDQDIIHDRDKAFLNMAASRVPAERIQGREYLLSSYPGAPKERPNIAELPQEKFALEVLEDYIISQKYTVIGTKEIDDIARVSQALFKPILPAERQQEAFRQNLPQKIRAAAVSRGSKLSSYQQVLRIVDHIGKFFADIKQQFKTRSEKTESKKLVATIAMLKSQQPKGGLSDTPKKRPATKPRAKNNSKTKSPRALSATSR